MGDSITIDKVSAAFDIAHGHSDRFIHARATVEKALDGMKAVGILSSYQGKTLVEKSGCVERACYILNCLEFSKAEAKRRSYRVRATYRLDIDRNAGDQLRLVLSPCGTQARIMLKGSPEDIRKFVVRLRKGERFDAFDKDEGALMLPALRVVMADLSKRFQIAHKHVSSLSRVLPVEPR